MKKPFKKPTFTVEMTAKQIESLIALCEVAKTMSEKSPNSAFAYGIDSKVIIHTKAAKVHLQAAIKTEPCQ